MAAWIRFWTAAWVGWIALSGRAIDLVLCSASAKPEQPTKGPADAAESADKAEEAGEKPKDDVPQEKAGETAPAEGSPALRILCLVLAAGFIYGLPWTTRITIAAAAAWVLTALALGYIATMPPEPEKNAEDDDQEQPEGEAPEPEQHPSELLPLDHVAVLLSEAYTEGSGVHLAHLAERLTRTPLMGLPATPWKSAHVRALLTRHGVRVRPGVRVPPVGGREGVHRDDFPPLPPTGPAPLVVGVVSAGQPNNNNASNAPYPFRITDDPTHPVRHHVHHERA
ncbi:hypothetical protein AB0G97_08985 [Streptomyces sp. NPDC020755]|uniref:hypothetical protein n=1 Tax=Streptomyces sp. NPDC020755 TaxID=3154790 RepID=UPI0034062FAD